MVVRVCVCVRVLWRRPRVRLRPILDGGGQERGLRAVPLAAAYRCVHHWDQILGEGVVTSMPYKFWQQFDAIPEPYEVKRTIEDPIEPAIMATLEKLKFFQTVYDEKLAHTEFIKLSATKDTLNQFLSARDDLLKIIRERMIV